MYMLATFKMSYFQVILANHRYWEPDTLIITLPGVRAIFKVSGPQHPWLAGGYDLEIGHF